MPIFRKWALGTLMFTTTAFLAQEATAQDQSSNDKYFEISKNLDLITNVFKELNTYYVDPIQPGDLTKTALDDMLETLDPYTNFITEAEAEDFRFQTTGKYGGIGSSIRTNDSDEIVIAEPYENSPIAKAGIKSGDIVVSIDGQILKGKDPDEVSLLLRGAPNTSLKMVIKNPQTQKVETKVVQREEISLSSVPYAGFLGKNKDVAYVYLTQFTQNCASGIRNALDSLKKVNPQLKSVVLDLRNNPGGLLDEAVKVCNLFIDKDQLVVSTKGKNKDWDKAFKTSGTPWDLKIPLVVLVNHGSASASEIVSGTMQDLDRGVIIGTRSFGKGLVQTVRPIGYNTNLKVTTAKYYTPSGRCIQALDYSHRNADGSVNTVPDSLKKAFKTADGRKVYDGGGVDPDVKIPDETYSRIAIALSRQNKLFDYGTKYFYTHKSIESPEKFSITDADYNEFKDWLKANKFTYKTQSEEALDQLKKYAQDEKYFESIKKNYDALEKELDNDKVNDLDKNKTEIKDLLNNDIVGRYYYQKGKTVYKLSNNDSYINKALEVLNDAGNYNKLLGK